MRAVTTAFFAVSAIALSGCLGGTPSSTTPAGTSMDAGASTRGAHQQPTRLSSTAMVVPAFKRRETRTWMRPPDASTRLAYVSDFGAGNVTVFGRNGAVRGQIGGLFAPEGLYVDSQRNLWVANSLAGTILKFARGGTSPIATLNDPSGEPVDVALCPGGTVYVSNLTSNSGSGNGNIQAYAAGSENPTGTLSYPGEAYNFDLTCDASGNIFTTILYAGSAAGVIEYPAANESNALDLGINVGYPGGIKLDNAGNLLVDDQAAHAVTEYTESGIPTGAAFNTGSGDVVDIGVTRDGLVVGGADVSLQRGTSWIFPGGAMRQTYAAPGAALPIGFAFDPGQKWL